MRIHKEGRQTILLVGTLCAILISLAYIYLPTILATISWILVLGFYIFILSFFRNPERTVYRSETEDNRNVIAPADGKVVVIEKVKDSEFMSAEWTQISIFMSPLNVHVNRHPVDGEVLDFAYHKGKYLVAWNPKSSTENERTTVLYKSGKHHIKLRQIAGAVARRIVSYCEPGQIVEKGTELGFIKFGSRVDILVPPESKITVNIGQKVSGNTDRIAILPQ